jgi:hypothetical protein
MGENERQRGWQCCLCNDQTKILYSHDYVAEERLGCPACCHAFCHECILESIEVKGDLCEHAYVRPIDLAGICHRNDHLQESVTLLPSMHQAFEDLTDAQCSEVRLESLRSCFDSLSIADNEINMCPQDLSNKSNVSLQNQ